jgi:glycosyltransferase involved in cell wall biosynthesis
LGISDIVTFEPPSDDVLTRMAAADLLVVASDYEGQPIVVIEALALGKPVVATAVGRVPELVTPDVGRVVPPQDAEALGRALAEVAGDERLRNSMSGNAAARPTRPTLDDVLDAHLELYTRAAAMGSGTTPAG